MRNLSVPKLLFPFRRGRSQPLSLYGVSRRTALGQRTASSIATETSVSPTEVSKFSEMNETWWDARRNPLIAMNPVRVGYIVDAMKATNRRNVGSSESLPLEGYKALDIGCGGGLLSESLARLGADVTAVDPSKPLVDMAKRHAQLDPRTKSIDFHGGMSVEDLVQKRSPSEEFDLICILEVLEHADNVHSLLEAASSLLKKPDDGNNGGLLFVSTINQTLKSHMLAVVGAEYIMGYLPVGTHDWSQFRSPDEVAQLMAQVGLEPVSVAGMAITQPPFFGNWKWKIDTEDTDVNWIGAYRHSSTGPTVEEQESAKS